MKLNIDVDPEDKDEIRKIISFLEQLLGENQNQTVEGQISPTRDDKDEVGLNNLQKPAEQSAQNYSQDLQENSENAVVSSQQPTQTPAPANQPNQNTAPQQPQNAQDDENYGQATASIMGMFNSEVPSNMPLKDIQNQQNQTQLSDDDDEDMDNDLGLDIVPY